MVLVFAEQRERSLKKVAFEALLIGARIAEQRSEQVTACILGSDTDGLGQEITRFGVDRVLAVEDRSLEYYTSEAYTQALVKLVREHGPSVVVLSATAMGKDLGASLAAALETQLLQDCIAVDFEADGTLVATRPVFAGKALRTVKAPDAKPLVLTMRPRAVGMKSETGGTGTVESVPASAENLRQRVAEVVKSVVATVELTEADIIVSGGRGMKGPESYALLEELAKTVGAAVGASRAAVDAGWRDHQFQVGQTGKVVAPSLYIACGISGAIQHLVGMIGSKCIVAVNKDPEANIFKVADYGVVGDLFKVVPMLTEEFRKLAASA